MHTPHRFEVLGERLLSTLLDSSDELNSSDTGRKTKLVNMEFAEPAAVHRVTMLSQTCLARSMGSAEFLCISPPYFITTGCPE